MYDVVICLYTAEDIVQALGRGGRDGRPCLCAVLYIPELMRETQGTTLPFLNDLCSAQCARQFISKTFDGDLGFAPHPNHAFCCNSNNHGFLSKHTSIPYTVTEADSEWPLFSRFNNAQQMLNVAQEELAAVNAMRHVNCQIKHFKACHLCTFESLIKKKENFKWAKCPQNAPCRFPCRGCFRSANECGKNSPCQLKLNQSPHNQSKAYCYQCLLSKTGPSIVNEHPDSFGKDACTLNTFGLLAVFTVHRLMSHILPIDIDAIQQLRTRHFLKVHGYSLHRLYAFVSKRFLSDFI